MSTQTIAGDPANQFEESPDGTLRRRLGSNIKFWRTVRGISQRELSERSGITIRSISKYENGGSGITTENANRIAQAMGMDISDLTRERS